jgi:hypothetical protein
MESRFRSLDHGREIPLEVKMAQSRFLGLFILTAMLVSSRDSRADNLRCGDQLASNGASLYEVKAICGDPDAATQRVEARTIYQRVAGPCVVAQGRTVCGSTVQQVVEVIVDEWIYDFGNNRFIHFVRFENGRLLQVTLGGYGKKPPA